MQGVFTALITPLTNKNELDLPAFKKILKAQSDAKINGIVLFGSTGESITLTLSEKQTLLDLALSELKGTGIQVIAGTGNSSTQATHEFSLWASKKGVDAVLLISPFYNKPTQEGLEAHFRATADVVQCEVALYNHPGRTGVTLAPETLGRLSTHPRITTLKQSSDDLTQIDAILEAVKAQSGSLDILAGDDILFLPSLALGTQGVISVTSNLLPEELILLYTAFKAQNIREASRIHRHLYPLFRDLFIESNPIPIKYAMSVAQYCGPALRAPLTQLSESATHKLDATLKRYLKHS